MLDVPVVPHSQRRDADDTGMPGIETGRLDVDDSPTSARLGGRSAPSEVGFAHVARMARPADKSGGHRSVSPP
jgi:hypothetical protein